MQTSVHALLAPVRRRQQAAFALRTTVYGLLAGSLAGAGFGLFRWTTGRAIDLGPAIAVLAAGPVLGVLIGLGWRRGWHKAAAAVDRHYRLKDRSATALAFLAKAAPGDLHRLQIADAEKHLGRVEPRQVVPIRCPRPLPYAVAVLALAVVLLSWPLKTAEVSGSPAEPLPQVVAEAERIQEALHDLEEVARQEENKELEKLVEELKQKAEAMKQPGVDEREALVKLSEMQAAIQAQQAQYNTEVMDGQLQSLGAAMSAATALEGAGKALQEAKYDKAEKELDKLDDPKLDRKELKTVEEKLKQVAKESGEVGLGQLSGAVSDFADSLKEGKGNAKRASKALAKEVRNQARRKRINNLLDAELARLREGKCNCQGNSTAKGKRPEKSTTPSSNWGMGTSGNALGEKTKLLSQRNQVDLTGDPGEGPSDVETTASPEARQQAQRGYKEAYNKYRKLSEAVLDSEPIPLGHRQTIRRYFELIRPQSGDGSEKMENADRPKP
jgi:hypothetical protein